MGTVRTLPAGTTLDEFSVREVKVLRLPILLRCFISVNWKVEKAKNRSLTRDSIHFVVGESEDSRSYDVVHSTYDVFKFLSKLQSHECIWRNLEKHRWLRTVLGLEVLRNLYLVNVVTILDGKDFLLFAVSGAHTHLAGKIVPVGGMLDQENMEDESPFYSNFAKELEEEMGLDASNPNHISSYSVSYLGRRNDRSVELIVLAQTPLSEDEVENHQQHADAEFSRLYPLQKNRTAAMKLLQKTPANKQWENLRPVLKDMFHL